MFSATFDKYIEDLASKMLRLNFFRAYIGSYNTIAETVKQTFVQVYFYYYY